MYLWNNSTNNKKKYILLQRYYTFLIYNLYPSIFIPCLSYILVSIGFFVHNIGYDLIPFITSEIL